MIDEPSLQEMLQRREKAKRDAIESIASYLGFNQRQLAARIARAICCPGGCPLQVIGECYCDMSDYHGSGIEDRTNAVLAALALPSTERGSEKS